MRRSMSHLHNDGPPDEKGGSPSGSREMLHISVQHSIRLTPARVLKEPIRIKLLHRRTPKVRTAHTAPLNRHTIRATLGREVLTAMQNQSLVYSLMLHCPLVVHYGCPRVHD